MSLTLHLMKPCRKLLYLMSNPLLIHRLVCPPLLLPVHLILAALL